MKIKFKSFLCCVLSQLEFHTSDEHNNDKKNKKKACKPNTQKQNPTKTAKTAAAAAYRERITL